jgi:hypothetical protein
MSAANAAVLMHEARDLAAQAVEVLQEARKEYLAADLPAGDRQARVAALTADIEALKSAAPNPDSHPWIGDRS